MCLLPRTASFKLQLFFPRPPKFREEHTLLGYRVANDIIGVNDRIIFYFDHKKKAHHTDEPQYLI